MKPEHFITAETPTEGPWQAKFATDGDGVFMTFLCSFIFFVVFGVSGALTLMDAGMVFGGVLVVVTGLIILGAFVIWVLRWRDTVWCKRHWAMSQHRMFQKLSPEAQARLPEFYDLINADEVGVPWAVFDAIEDTYNAEQRERVRPRYERDRALADKMRGK